MIKRLSQLKCRTPLTLRLTRKPRMKMAVVRTKPLLVRRVYPWTTRQFWLNHCKYAE